MTRKEKIIHNIVWFIAAFTIFTILDYPINDPKSWITIVAVAVTYITGYWEGFYNGLESE